MIMSFSPPFICFPSCIRGHALHIGYCMVSGGLSLCFILFIFTFLVFLLFKLVGSSCIPISMNGRDIRVLYWCSQCQHEVKIPLHISMNSLHLKLHTPLE